MITVHSILENIFQTQVEIARARGGSFLSSARILAEMVGVEFDLADARDWGSSYLGVELSSKELLKPRTEFSEIGKMEVMLASYLRYLIGGSMQQILDECFAYGTEQAHEYANA